MVGMSLSHEKWRYYWNKILIINSTAIIITGWRQQMVIQLEIERGKSGKCMGIQNGMQSVGFILASFHEWVGISCYGISMFVEANLHGCAMMRQKKNYPLVLCNIAVDTATQINGSWWTYYFGICPWLSWITSACWAVVLALDLSRTGSLCINHRFYQYMGGSINGGTPKSSNLMGFSLVTHPFWGTSIYGNLHIGTNPLKIKRGNGEFPVNGGL